MNTTHTITVGSVTRALPSGSRPDIRVALFNLLGDWELTEAPAPSSPLILRAQVLLMPDEAGPPPWHGRISSSHHRRPEGEEAL